MNKLADNLRALIDAQRISESELADRTGVPQPTINRILRGESRDPRDRTVEPLAAYFGMSVESMRRGTALPDGRSRQPGEDQAVQLSRGMRGSVSVPHAIGFDQEAGPANMSFPEMMLRELMHLSSDGRLAWIVNPTDSVGEVIPKGAIAFVDRSYKEVRGNGIYALRLFGEPAIMRIQVRGESELRVMGSNRFEESIDLYGDQTASLSIGGLVVGYVPRIKLIE